MLARFLARQLGHPSGAFGRWFLAPLWNRRNAALNDLAFDELGLEPTDRVLEVGFGGGYLLSRMGQVVTRGALVGVDAAPCMVARGRRRLRQLIAAGRLELRCAPAEALPFASASFDKCGTVNSAFYWHDPTAALAELRRVLRPGGRLAVCLTSRRSIECKSFARHGLTLYDAPDIQQRMRRAGFANVRTTQRADTYREFFCVVGE